MTDTQKLYKDAEIDGKIASVKRRAGTLQADIHKVGVSILYVWQNATGKKTTKPEDALAAATVAVDRLNALESASPYHTKAFNKWVREYTPCQWSDEAKAWYINKTDTNMHGKAFVEARDTPFWKVSPPPEPKPYDMWDALQKIITTGQKRQENPVDGDVIDGPALRKLTQILSAHEAKSHPADG